MRCPNCSAECSEQSSHCEFCGQPLQASAGNSGPVVEEIESASPPPLPFSAETPPPVGGSFESDNPYAASDSSTYGHPQIPAFEVPNHFPLSISSAVLSFLCCCIPFGIIPVIFSAQVNSKLANGDYEGAQASSRHAKLWSWICIGVALSMFLLNMIMQFVLGMGSLGI